MFNAVKKLKKYNYEHIYYPCLTSDQRQEIENKFRCVVNKFLQDLNNKNMDSPIYKSYLNNMSKEYQENTNERIVLDYVSGMTDDYFNSEYSKIIINSKNK